MNSGKLRQVINIYKLTAGALNAIGDTTTTEELITNGENVRAEVWSISGEERMSAMALNAEVTHKFRIRYLDEVDSSCIIYLGSRKFFIVYINNRNECNRELILTCKELTAE